MKLKYFKNGIFILVAAMLMASHVVMATGPDKPTAPGQGVQRIEIKNDTKYKVQVMFRVDAKTTTMSEIEPGATKTEKLEGNQYAVGEGTRYDVGFRNAYNGVHQMSIDGNVAYNKTSGDVLFSYDPSTKTAKVTVNTPKKLQY